MTGIQLLEQARAHCPEAKFLLLTAYADTDVAISAINDIGLDYYLLKPWDPPAERLYPVVDDLLDDWRPAHVDHSSEVRVIGHRWSDRSHETKMFLAHNHVPYHWYDVERDAEASRLLAARRCGPGRPAARAGARRRHTARPDVPRTRGRAGSPDRRAAPALRRLHRGRWSGRPRCRRVRRVRGAEHRRRGARGTRRPGRHKRLDRELPRLPEGAQRLRPRPAGAGPGLGGSVPSWCWRRTSPRCETRGPVQAVLFEGGGEIEARSLIVATGVSYRRLEAAGLEELTGRGVYYGASASEAEPVRGRRGLPRRCGQLRRPGSAQPLSLRQAGGARGPRRPPWRRRCRATWSSASRPAQPRGPPRHRGGRPAGATVTSRRITLRDRASGDTVDVDASWLFVFIGASPRTDWLGTAVVRDDHGFVVTGHDVRTGRGRPGPSNASRSHSRPACPACSPRATYASTR